MSGITVLSPVAFNRVESRAVAPRLASLEGVRLGLLTNSKPNAAPLLEHVAELLGERHRLDGIVRKQKPHSSIGAEGLDVYAREVNAALVAVGD